MPRPESVLTLGSGKNSTCRQTPPGGLFVVESVNAIGTQCAVFSLRSERQNGLGKHTMKQTRNKTVIYTSKILLHGPDFRKTDVLVASSVREPIT
jgi:hypothetical protein